VNDSTNGSLEIGAFLASVASCNVLSCFFIVAAAYSFPLVAGKFNDNLLIF
jgi:hypothetical protein